MYTYLHINKGIYVKVITFLNNKGGTGKSTLCLNLAQSIALRLPAAKLLLVDADTQGSLRNWHDIIPRQLDLVCADKRQALWSAKRMAEQIKVDYLLIDTPGKINEVTSAALTITNLAIIPIKPSPLDIWATIDTIDLLKCAMIANPFLKGLFVINQAVVHSTINADIAEALQDADAEQEIDLAPLVIHGRVAFARSINSGHTIFESGDQSGINEIKLLTNEVLNKLNHGNN